MKYYSTQRPVMPGSYPRQGVVEIVNYDKKTYCEEIGRDAWGYIEYDHMLSEEAVKDYELTPEGMTIWYCVTSMFFQDGRAKAAITANMEALEKPEGYEKQTKTKRISANWYNSLTEAEQAVADVLGKGE